MDPVGVISLVIDVSKDLYTYYRAVRDCDTDIKELRTQLLLLHHTAGSLTAALKLRSTFVAREFILSLLELLGVLTSFTLSLEKPMITSPSPRSTRSTLL